MKQQNLIRFAGGPFAYPTGRLPGISKGHPASQGLRGSFIAVTGAANMISLTSGLQGTISSTPTSGINANVGPFFLTANASTQNTTFANQSTAVDSQQTIACIFELTATGGNKNLFLTTTANTTSGYRLFITTTGVIEVFGGGTQIGATFTLAANVPYFFAASVVSAHSSIVLVNHSTGATQTNTATTAYTASAGNGTYIIGNSGAGSAGATAKTATMMNSTAFLSKNHLLAWANDPWSFWYPNDDIFQLGTPPAGLTLAPSMMWFI